MKRYEMTDEYRTGNRLIDTEHETIFKEANALLEACEAGRGRDQVSKAAAFLVGYVAKHFADEEDLQIRYQYPDYPNHHKFHEWYEKDLQEKIDKLEESADIFQAIGTIAHEIDVLVKHIRTEDKKLAKWIREHGEQGAAAQGDVQSAAAGGEQKQEQPAAAQAAPSADAEKLAEKWAVFMEEGKNMRQAVSQIKSRAKGLEQTATMEKMLSLNAGIEAGRAGKAGVGFNVVAEEIGRMANESAAVYREIQELVKQVEQSIERIDRAGEKEQTNGRHSL